MNLSISTMNQSFAIFLISILSIATGENIAIAGTNRGEEILRCFHPFGVYIDDIVDENNESRGRIFFEGIISELLYEMDYIIRESTLNGNIVFKVEVTRDTAPFIPSPECRLNSWTEID